MQHRKHRSNTLTFSRKQRAALAAVGLLVSVFGIAALARGSLHYPNWWGGAVFAPFAICIGGLAIVVALITGRNQ